MDEKSTAFVLRTPDKVPNIDLHGDESGIDPVYQAKSRILNRAIQDIGMGKYQVNATWQSVYHTL